MIGLTGECSVRVAKGVLILAESANKKLENNDSPPVDFTSDLQALQSLRDAEDKAKKLLEEREEATSAERERQQGAAQQRAQATKDAEAARLAAAQAAVDGREAARAAEEARRVRAACRTIYQSTVDKKIRDLTVGEDQQVRACQGLGLYLPR